MLFDSGTIAPVAPLNALAQADLAKMRKSTGIGYLEPPPPVHQPTAQELLEQRVISDWSTLRIVDFKRNCANDKEYRATFERLSAEDKLGSGVATFHHRITEDGTLTSRS
jgi:hypothetical protein